MSDGGGGDGRDRDRREADRDLIRRFTDQPAALPTAVREAAARLGAGGPLQLYALADLDEGLRLTERWLVLGPDQIAVLDAAGAVLGALARESIRAVLDRPRMSCGELLFEAAGGRSLVVRYSQRQKRAMENIRFVVQRGLTEEVGALEDPDGVYAAAVAGPVKDAQAGVARNQMSVVLRLLGYFLPYRADLLIGAGAAVVMTLLMLAPPYLTKVLIDEVIRPVSEGRLAPGRVGATALTVLIVLAASFLVREICTWFRFRKMAYLGEYVARDLRREAYAHLQRLSVGFFSKKQTGSLISRVSSDTDRLWEFLAFGVVEFSLAALMLGGLAAVLLWLDRPLGLVMLVPVPLYLGAFYLHGRIIGRRFLKAWRKWSDLMAVLSDAIPGMRVVKAFSQEGREQARFAAKNQGALEAFTAIHDSWTGFWPLLMLAFHAVTIAVWGLAVARVTGTWGPPLSVGTFTAFLLYMGMFLYPLEVIGQVTRMMNRAASSAHRVFEILDTEPRVVEVAEPRRPAQLAGHIEFAGVGFSYDGVRQVLHGISFAIRPGEMVGLVGPSGAGKSTIINLLARFYDATAGRVLIDGIDLRELDLEWFRRRIGIVQQEPFLFHGSILENIRYGKPEADFEEVVAAARVANAHDFICRLALGYETVVGERGHTLSGGERQRVSLARAILHDPRVLILDEATSNVDTETERKIQEALQRAVAGRTVLAIAHRLSTLQRADRLLVIKDGRLVEQGTHAELLAIDDGVYRKLHLLQRELHAQFAI